MSTRILIMEDNAANLRLMSYLLESYGHVILAARDGLEGVELVLRERPDLILCDLQMPKLDGFDVAHRLKNDPELAGIPLVAVTALAMAGDSVKVRAAGFDGYISKPISLTSFVSQVQQFLTSCQAPELALHGR